MPAGLVIALIAGTMLIATIICLIVMTRLPFERRAAFGRFLGHGFLVLLVLSVIAGMVAQLRG